MADRHLKFFDKKGHPLNFEYVGAEPTTPLTLAFNYETSSGSSSPASGKISFFSLSSNIIYINSIDMNGLDISSWANSVNQSLIRGAKITLKLNVIPAIVILAEISSAAVMVTVTIMLMELALLLILIRPIHPIHPHLRLDLGDPSRLLIAPLGGASPRA